MNETETLDGLRKYMDQMDQELMSTNIGQSFNLTVNYVFTHESSWTSSGNNTSHYICPFCRITTRPDWSMAPLQPPPPTVSRRKRQRRSSPLTSTSIWSQTCWSPSALRPDWLDRHLTCCRVWVYTCHPTLIPHKGQGMDLGNDWGGIWRAQTRKSLSWGCIALTTLIL